MPKMRQNTFGGRAPPGPAGGAYEICADSSRNMSMSLYKKLSYRRGIARCVVSVQILPVATQQCKNYMYDES